MPRSAPGNSVRRRGSRGFTLIELMIVVVLIAVASSVASLALRDPASTTLEREAARLAALLESARAEARASGLSASWEPRALMPESPGFRFVNRFAFVRCAKPWTDVDLHQPGYRYD